ncbi:tetratricopeptide repeat protein [Schlesneria paludicola]|uniref:tetratricopeptide repeat protein n=1 Tax=Schlesneria paludicola TaxID=360056 RepID=UPI00029B19CE|nr:tetratricopeptide repeat protein [Schlesneria paludicola]
MSANAHPLPQQIARSPASGSPNPWILSSWWDQLLIVSTPLLVVPIVFLLASPWVGVQAETIAIVVTAFFALGHHLPGMIRAYGDQELFQRFRLRFILTPLTLIAVSVPLYRHHYDVFLLTLYFWGCWHGLMQLYGFVRIYDAKVGSTAPITAYLDWLMCLSWFPTALLFSHRRTAEFLGFWYSFGGPTIPPAAIPAFRWGALALSISVMIAFLVNYAVQSARGRPPNPVKVMMLASGIGFWWFSFVYLQFSGLSVTLYEIAHDVQYMAITWLYNCRRVKSNPEFDGFMRFVFRRGMALLYLGLIAGYGALGLVPTLVQDGSVFAFFNAFILISTILHYYYDGFIWKVREKSTQTSLGVAEADRPPRPTLAGPGGFAHLMKWSPAILFVGWLFVTDLTDPSLSAETKKNLTQQYEQQLSNSTALPKSEDEQSWLYTEFVQAQNIAASVPDDESAQMRAAFMLANFGQNEEATKLLERLVQRQPSSADGHQLLGEVYVHRGSFGQAIQSFEAALSFAKTKKQRTNANLKLGEIYLVQKDSDRAKAHFQAAVNESPQIQSVLKSLRKNEPNSVPEN